MSTQTPWLAAAQTIKDETEDLFLTLHKICNEIGYKEETNKVYREQACQHFKSLIQDMRDEIVTKKEELLQTISSLLKEIHDLSKQLKIDPGLGNMDNIALVDVRTRLESQVELFKRTKEQRLKYLEELLEKERTICAALGVKAIGRSYSESEIPTNEDLESFKLYIQKQETEKNRFENTFKDMRHSIMRMMDELNITPALEFESLICNDPENFVFTANNMQKLRDLRDNLKKNLEAAKEKAQLKREELVELWNYLDVPEASCKAFLDRYSGHSLTDIHALNEEIKRCKQQRMENIAKYVEKVREQLEQLWDTCRFSEEQRKQFKPFYVQNYTEDLLALYDLEVEKLRKFYNENKKIYDLLEEFESLWEKVRELDQRKQDPERLHNRGGQLLIEERERKMIHKKTPLVQEQLLNLVKEYEATHGVTFTIDGKVCEEYMSQHWENFVKVKETDKKARAKAKDKSLKVKTPLMSTSRRTPVASTSSLRPCTSAKRRDDKSPLAHSAKRRLVQSEKTASVVCTSRVRRSGRVSRRLLANSRAQNTSNRSTRKQDTTNDTQNTIGSIAYEQFQGHLAQHEELRSSVLPDEVLKAVRNKTKMRTPVKTPVKPLRKNLSAVNTPKTPNKTPKTSHVRETSRSPRLMSTPRLATAPTMPIFF